MTDADRHRDDDATPDAAAPGQGPGADHDRAPDPSPADVASAAAARYQEGEPSEAAPTSEEGDAPAHDPSGDGGSDASEVVDLELAAEQDPRSPGEVLAELMEAEARRDEYLDDLRRARAEFENFRRRTMREGASQRDAGKADVLSGVLEVLDDLDRTLDAAESSDDASLAKGIGLVAGKLVHALQSQGLERIDEVGVEFDPNQHEAVQQVAADEPGGQPVVAQVMRPGYRAGDRVLRAAMVVVEQ